MFLKGTSCFVKPNTVYHVNTPFHIRKMFLKNTQNKYCTDRYLSELYRLHGSKGLRAVFSILKKDVDVQYCLKYMFETACENLDFQWIELCIRYNFDMSKHAHYACMHDLSFFKRVFNLYIHHQSSKNGIFGCMNIVFCVNLKKQYRTLYKNGFFGACIYGNLELLQYFEQNNVHHFQSGLKLSCVNGQKHIVHYLLDRLESTLTIEEYRFETWKSIMYDLSRLGDLDLVKRVLRILKFLTHITDKQDRWKKCTYKTIVARGLFASIKYGRTECAQFLIEYLRVNGKIDDIGNIDWFDCFEMACKKNLISIVKSLDDASRCKTMNYFIQICFNNNSFECFKYLYGRYGEFNMLESGILSM